MKTFLRIADFLPGVLGLVFLAAGLGGCSLGILGAAEKEQNGRLILAAFGSSAQAPVTVENDTPASQTLRSIRFDIFFGDRQVTSGEQEFTKSLEPRSEVNVTVTFPIDEQWLVDTPGFTATASVPYQLKGHAQLGDASVPVESKGRLLMPPGFSRR